MKKLGILWGILAIINFTCSKPCYASNALTAPYSFKVDQNTVTQTTFRITWADSNDVAPDSLSLRYLSGSDTLFIKYLTVGTITNIVTELSPRTTYIVLLSNLRNDSLAVSNKDTLTTSTPKIEDANRVKPNMITMQGARYDQKYSSTALWDTMYVSTSAGLDSTQVYWASEYLGLQAYADGNADSCKVNLLVFCGKATPSIWGFENVAKDSVVITKAGWSTPKQLSIPPSGYIYVRADGQTDNGNATKLFLNLFRYGEISKQ